MDDSSCLAMLSFSFPGVIGRSLVDFERSLSGVPEGNPDDQGNMSEQLSGKWMRVGAVEETAQGDRVERSCCALPVFAETREFHCRNGNCWIKLL